MTDPYAEWLDEALGDRIRYHIQLAPTVATGYARAFRGDPVALDWLTTTAGADPAPVADSSSTDDSVEAAGADQLDPDLDPVLRATVEELLPHLSDEDAAILAGMTALELAAAVEEARSEALTGLVEPLPQVTTDDVLTDGAEGYEPGASFPAGADGDSPQVALSSFDDGGGGTPLQDEELRAQLSELHSLLSSEEREMLAVIPEKDQLEALRDVLPIS